jgi:hypothetical protein
VDHRWEIHGKVSRQSGEFEKTQELLAECQALFDVQQLPQDRLDQQQVQGIRQTKGKRRRALLGELPRDDQEHIGVLREKINAIIYYCTGPIDSKTCSVDSRRSMLPCRQRKRQ